MKFIIIRKRVIKIVVALILICVLLALSIDGKDSASVYFGMTTRRVPIYSVDTDEKKVAITFDSAWGADKTQSILDTLEDYNCKATFFLVGFWVEDYPEQAKAIAESGCEIGTHSNTHADFTTLSKSQMEQELTTSMEIIQKTCGVTPTLFRSPYGAYNNTSIEVAESLGLTTIQWDVDSLDWKGLSAMEICTRILDRVQNGSIILNHNNADYVLDALPLVLDRLIKKGYTITTVSDLIYDGEYTIDHMGIQHKK